MHTHKPLCAYSEYKQYHREVGYESGIVPLETSSYTMHSLYYKTTHLEHLHNYRKILVLVLTVHHDTS